MKAALLVTWTAPFPGREMKALEFAVEANEYWGKLAAEGKCTTPEEFVSTGTGHGYWLVKGDRATLAELMEGEIPLALSAKGVALLQDYTYELVLAEDSVEQFFGNYADAVTKIG